LITFGLDGRHRLPYQPRQLVGRQGCRGLHGYGDDATQIKWLEKWPNTVPTRATHAPGDPESECIPENPVQVTRGKQTQAQNLIR